MQATNFLKTNFKYCVVGEKDHLDNLFTHDLGNNYPNKKIDVLCEDTDTFLKKEKSEIKEKEDIFSVKNVNVISYDHDNEKKDKQESLDLTTMILFSLPSFGKMSSLVMLK